MARKRQETLVLFPEVLRITRKFTDAQFGALMRAAFAYRFGGELYAGDDAAVDVAFQMVANQIDRHAEACAINAENRTGVSKDSESHGMQGNPTESQEMQENPTPIHSISISSPIPIHDDIEVEADKPPTRHRFSPPAVDDVKRYCQEQGYSVDPERFVDFYTSNGWKVGKNPMRDWKAAVRSWNRKEKPNNGETESKPLWTIGTVV